MLRTYKRTSLHSIVLFIHLTFALSSNASQVSRYQTKIYDLSTFTPSKAVNSRNIIRNGSFEAGKRGWRLARGAVVDRPFGRNGTAGLQNRRSDPTVYTFSSTTIPAKPNTKYEFGAWVKTRDIRGTAGGAGVCIEFSDKKTGKYMNGLYKFPNYKGTTDWTKISGEFTVPANTRASIVLYIRRGMVGEAIFDDVYVKEVGISWQVYMYNPAYNTISLDESGKALGRFRVTANGVAPKQKQLVLQLRLNDKLTIASKVIDGEAMFDLQQLSLIKGKSYKCHAVLLDIARNNVLHTNEFPLRVRMSDVKPKGSIVRFTPNNVAIVDGKKFMPLGFYTAWARDRNIELVKQAGGNTILAYSSFLGNDEKGVERTRTVLDKVHAAGLKFIFSIKDQQRTGYNAWTLKKWGQYTEAVDTRGEMIKAFRDHPAMLAWFAIDENPLAQKDNLIAMRRQINALDPNHPVCGTHYNYANFGELSQCWDVAGIDPYTISGNNYFLTTIRFAGLQSAKTKLPVWATVESFHNGTYDKKNKHRYRMPTERQMRGIMLQMAGKGVKGFILYHLDDVQPRRAPEKGMFEKFWPGLKRTFKLFREIEPYITSEHPIQEVSTSLEKERIGAYRLISDDKSEIIILTVINAPIEAVINVKNPAQWTSRYGKTRVENGQLVFKGRQMDSDVLFRHKDD